MISWPGSVGMHKVKLYLLDGLQATFNPERLTNDKEGQSGAHQERVYVREVEGSNCSMLRRQVKFGH